VEELRSRLREGKIYKPEKVEQALANFFRKGNLSTLRELALRAVADEVGEKAASYRAREGLEPALIPERVMVCMSRTPWRRDPHRRAHTGRLGRWYAVYARRRARNPTASALAMPRRCRRTSASRRASAPPWCGCEPSGRRKG
jgi:two-component system sensor histidine kinase KdpD